MGKKKVQKVETAHLVTALNTAGDGDTININLIPRSPDGTVQGRDGRYWKMGDPAAVAMASNAYKEAHGASLDENHGMYLGETNSPAFGWFSQFEVNSAAGIDGKCELNDLGQNAIKNKHYRYASVVFEFDPETLEITFIKGAGLTNKQNLQVQALNTAATVNRKLQEEGMLKALLIALGLKEDATETDAQNAIQTLKSAQTALNAQGDVVPKAEHDKTVTALNTAKDELKTLKDAAFKQTLETALNTAMTEKKITPAQRKHYEETIKDEAALNTFQELMKVSPEVLSDQAAPGGTPEQPTALNTATTEMAKIFGNTPEELKEHGGL
ncbi:MAG: phage protease [Kiritimatiellales bacterium]